MIGVDVSEAMLALARERSPGIEFLCADAQDMAPLRSEPFDLVYSNLAPMDIPDLGATYAAVARAPAGRPFHGALRLWLLGSQGLADVAMVPATV